MGPDLLRADLAALLPWFGLRLAHRGLVLVAPTDLELLELADVVAEPGGVLAPGEEHFLSWSTGTPDAARAFLRFHWEQRVLPAPDRWRLPFAILLDGRALGAATLESTPQTGVVATGSWLARAERGHGVGSRVRLMLLELAFAGLGASRAVAAAAPDNAAARAVSRRLGYRETGTTRRRGGGEELTATITPAAWRRRRLPDVELDGVDAVRAAIS